MRLARVPVSFSVLAMLLSGTHNARSDFWMNRPIVDIRIDREKERAYIYFKIPDFYTSETNEVKDDEYRPDDQVLHRLSELVETGGPADEWLQYKPEIISEREKCKPCGVRLSGRDCAHNRDKLCYLPDEWLNCKKRCHPDAGDMVDDNLNCPTGNTGPTGCCGGPMGVTGPTGD